MKTKSVKERPEVISADEIVQAIQAEVSKTSRSVNIAIGMHPTFGHSPGRPSVQHIDAIKAGGFDMISRILDRIYKLHR